MPVRNVPLAAAGPRVSDVMLRDARTVPAATTLAEVAAELENPKVRMLLVAEGDAYVGAIPLDGLPAGSSPGTPVGQLVDPTAPRVHPDAAVGDALALLAESGSDRLPVVSDAGKLVGLVCFNARRGHFCVDAEPASTALPAPGATQSGHAPRSTTSWVPTA